MTSSSAPQPAEPPAAPAGSGCLLAPLRWLQRLASGQKPASVAVGADAYKLRPTLLTPGGRALVPVLQAVLPEGHVVVPEVAFISLFDVKPRAGRQAARNKIIQKRVDFVIYEHTSMKPVCAIELDDVSHEEAQRRTRDAFADDVFRYTGLPLVHIRAAPSYDASEVARMLGAALRASPK